MQELDKSSNWEYQNSSAQSLSMDKANEAEEELHEDEDNWNNLKSKVTIVVECLLSPALSGKFFNWCELNFVRICQAQTGASRLFLSEISLSLYLNMSLSPIWMTSSKPR